MLLFLLPQGVRIRQVQVPHELVSTVVRLREGGSGGGHIPIDVPGAPSTEDRVPTVGDIRIQTYDTLVCAHAHTHIHTHSTCHMSTQTQHPPHVTNAAHNSYSHTYVCSTLCTLYG